MVALEDKQVNAIVALKKDAGVLRINLLNILTSRLLRESFVEVDSKVYL